MVTSVLALMALAVVLALYLSRRHRLVAAGATEGTGALRTVSFVAGIAVLAAALASPVARIAEQLLVWHTAQHILLIDAAPILLILGLSRELLEPLMQRLAAVERLTSVLTLPITAVLLYAGTLWAWHTPVLYDLALANEGVHALQHATVFAVGALLWWHVLGPVLFRRALRGLTVFPFMAGTKVLTAALGFVIMAASDGGFAYRHYADQPRRWGLSALQDQQIGGALMMLEEAILITAAFAFMFVRMLSHADREDMRREGDGPADGFRSRPTEG